ncbi:MAG: transcriptional regulator [Helicobacteraceae bacterium]|jgi:DNA-binding XRE family transcriptional regulator|nr:transcriptional regulator [Helicobacteraceae bacterium]
MTKRDIAGHLGIDVKTLYNWEKRRPRLYKIVMQGLKIEDAAQTARKYYEDLKKLTEDSDDRKE